MDHYVPVQESQERKASGDLADEQDDSDSAIEDRKERARRRARMRQEEATEQLAAINFVRPSRDQGSGPPGRKKRKTSPERPWSLRGSRGQSIELSAGTDDVDDNDSERVADSQGMATSAPATQPLPSAKLSKSSADSSAPLSRCVVAQSSDRRANTEVTGARVLQVAPSSHDEEVIPDTSPAVRLEELADNPAPFAKNARTLGRRSKKTYSRTNGTKGLQVKDELPRVTRLVQDPPAVSPRHERDHPLGDDTGHHEGGVAPSPSPNISAPLRKGIRHPPARPTIPETPADHHVMAPAQNSTSTSTLSMLSETPPHSSTTTPATQGPTPSSSTVGVHSSPSGVQHRRRTASSMGILPQLKTSLSKVLTRSSRQPAPSAQHASTDELALSPAGFEESMVRPRVATKAGTARSRKPHSLLFDGMAFAISFQSQRPGETAAQSKQRLSRQGEVEKEIKQAGGRILEDGFEEIFDLTANKNMSSPVSSSPAPPLVLTPAAETLGFTALIADGHSRKVKYMYALALGLPCISHRWVSDCLAKSEIVAWEPYLLASGQSTYLHEAIMSRTLAPYSATDAAFARTIEARTKLLDGDSILFVMKKTKNPATPQMAYITLAQVLGATIHRVSTLEEATRTIKKEAEPFDWVYMDEKSGGDPALLESVMAENGRRAKKRKRGGEDGEVVRKNRKLTSELVIQSLILGRIIDD